MYILGLTAPISWNNAAVLIKNGELAAAAEEERFIRVKHSPRTPPFHAAKFCIDYAGIDWDDISYIAVGFRDPFGYMIRNVHHDICAGRIDTLHLAVGSAVEYFIQFSKMKKVLEQLSPCMKNKRWVFIPHHIAHAASAFRMSGFVDTNVITLDGNGEDDSGGLYVFRNNGLKTIQKIKIVESLGMLYSCVTHLLGFVRHSGEGKTMGLAAYGKPIVDLDEFFTMDHEGLRVETQWVKKINRRFGPQRVSGESLNQEHKNLAASVQKKVEEIALQLVLKLQRLSPLNSLCIAGGVALNCDMNTKIFREGHIKNIFIQPAAHDAGTALGAALELYSRLGGKNRFTMEHAYWGPEYTNKEIEDTLRESKLEFKYHADIEAVAAGLLAQGKIIGWFQGRMEWGPRALGARSMLAHPGMPEMKERINMEVKHRETWRPFAPSILEEEADKYLENAHPSPFMLLTFNVRKEKQQDLIAALHVDGTARVQTVSKQTNPRYHRLIQEFQKITGIGAVLNTSFNDNGEAIVMSPKDAVRTFFSTGLDALIIGNFFVPKPGYRVKHN